MIKQNSEIINSASDGFKALIAGKAFNCWEKLNADFSLYVFTLTLDDTKELVDLWEGLSNEIAYEFQSKLEKQVEIWNIYLIFLSKSKVDKETKYKIEQNKYSSRKLVFDEFDDTQWTILVNDGIGNFLDKKLFQLSIPKNKKTISEAGSLRDLLSDQHAELIKIISNSTEKNQYKIFFDKYLEGHEQKDL